ncbi:hypothetical protein [Hydrogenophaga sp.]|uniref:hypothetical protein n=1 Tax=Hydrogenophaga sp. TaxID=1904254 RepID=UPI003563689B
MPTALQLQRLQTLIWVLIYGGLLTGVLGLALQDSDADLSWTLAVGGGLVALLGVVLIFVRARLKESP